MRSCPLNVIYVSDCQIPAAGFCASTPLVLRLFYEFLRGLVPELTSLSEVLAGHDRLFDPGSGVELF